MGDNTVISGWSKTAGVSESLSAYDAFDAYCQEGTEQENGEALQIDPAILAEDVAPKAEDISIGETDEVDTNHKRPAKRSRSPNADDPNLDPEVKETIFKNEYEEPVLETDEFDLEALYTEEPSAKSPKKRQKVMPIKDAPVVRRQAGLSAYPLSNGSTVYNFGPIEGIEVGAEFDSRDQARLANVHRASIKGIVGSQDIGCSSICVNGGYEDNEDTGYTIVYSGDGGKSPTNDEPGVDQTWTPMNRALFKSFKDHRAIRVLRGQKSKGKCAPVSGYRYDGLYQILRCWISRSVGFGHYKTIKFAMQRLPKQDPITRLNETFAEPDFILNDLSGDWIKMPKHYHLIAQDGVLVDPAQIHFDDEFGSMTPAELAKMRRKSKSKRPKAQNHAVKRESRGGDDAGPSSPSTGGRRFKSLDEATSASATQCFTPVNVITDQFGNVMPPATSPVLEQGPAEPVIENVEFHNKVNKETYRRLFGEAEIKHPTRGYMPWRVQCHADNTVYTNLDEMEAKAKQNGQQNGKP